jgi:hypothetical protein
MPALHCTASHCIIKRSRNTAKQPAPAMRSMMPGSVGAVSLVSPGWRYRWPRSTCSATWQQQQQQQDMTQAVHVCKAESNKLGWWYRWPRSTCSAAW